MEMSTSEDIVVKESASTPSGNIRSNDEATNKIYFLQSNNSIESTKSEIEQQHDSEHDIYLYTNRKTNEILCISPHIQSELDHGQLRDTYSIEETTNKMKNNNEITLKQESQVDETSSANLSLAEETNNRTLARCDSTRSLCFDREISIDEDILDKMKQRFTDISDKFQKKASSNEKTRSTFTSSFISTKNELSTAEDDLFGDFSYSSLDIMAQHPTKKMEFKKISLDDTDNDNEYSRKSSFLNRNTIWDLNSREPISKERGELELNVESDIFCDINSGEVHVIATIQCYYYLKAEKKKRELIYLSIARDWTGAYVLCLSKANSTSFTGKLTGIGNSKRERSVIAAYPLIDGFEIQILETLKQTCKYIIILDRVVLRIASGIKSKEKIEKYLNFAFSGIHEQLSDNILLNTRMASIEFAKAVEDAVPQPEKCIELVKRVLKSASNDIMGVLLDIRRHIRFATVRDSLLKFLINYYHSGSYSQEQANLFLDIYQESIYCLTTTKQPELKQELLSLFNEMIYAEEEREKHSLSIKATEETTRPCSENSTPPNSLDSSIKSSRLNFIKSSLYPTEKGANRQASEETFDFIDSPLSNLSEETIPTKNSNLLRNSSKLIDRIKLIKEQTEVVYQVILGWKGRGKLTYKPFPPEFVFIPQGISINRRCDKEKEKIRNVYQKEFKGIFLCTLFFTDEEIVVDSNGLLPNIRLSHCQYKQFEHLDFTSEEFEWLYSLGWNWFKYASNSEKVDKKKSLSPFVRDVIKSGHELSRKLNTDIGVLYDKLMKIPDLKCMLVLSLRKITDKNQLSIADKYNWQPRDITEHRLYQGYNNLDATIRIDTLDDSFQGARWITDSINFAEQFYSKTLEPGLYLCYLRLCNDVNGTNILVKDNMRMVPPFSFISKELPSREEWNWLQDTRKEDLPENNYEELISKGSSNTSENSFQQKFLTSLRQLKSKLLVDFIGYLYEEIVPMDEENKIYLIVYAENIQSTSDMSKEWKGKFLWKTLSLFENANAFVFSSKTVTAYKDYVIGLYFEGLNISESEYTTDEIVRYQLENNQILNAESAWSFMRWVIGVMYWCHKNTKPLYHSGIVTYKESTDKVSKHEFRKILGLNNEIRKIITQSVNVSWEGIYNRLKRIEKRKPKRKVNRKNKRLFDSRKAVILKETTVNSSQKKLEKQNQLIETEEEVPTLSIYDVDCTLEEIYKVEDLEKIPTNYEFCRSIINEVTELSILEAVDRRDLENIKTVVDEMVSIVESIEFSIENIEISWRQRNIIKEILEVRRNCKLDSIKFNEELLLDTEKSHQINVSATYDGYIHKMVDCFSQNISKAKKLLRVVKAAENLIELVDVFESYEHQWNISKQIYDEIVEVIQENCIEHPFIENQAFDGQQKKFEEDSVEINEKAYKEAEFEKNEREIQKKLLKTVDKTTSLIGDLYCYSPRGTRKLSSPENQLLKGSKSFGAVDVMEFNNLPHHSQPFNILTPRTNSSLKTMKYEGNVLNLVSIENTVFEVHIIENFNLERCKILRNRSTLGVLKTPYEKDVVAVVADFLQTNNFELFIKSLEDRIRKSSALATKLFEMVTEYEISHIYLFLAINLPVVDQRDIFLRFTKSFLLEYSIEDWLIWEVQYQNIKIREKIFDILFFIRYIVEIDIECLYSNHSGNWKHIYAEDRIHMFFKQPVKFQHKYLKKKNSKKEFIEREILLWKNYLGRSVHKLDFSSFLSFGDKELQVIIASCPNVTYLNLESTNITNNVISTLLKKCQKLNYLNIRSTNISKDLIIDIKNIVRVVDAS